MNLRICLNIKFSKMRIWINQKLLRLRDNCREGDLLCSPSTTFFSSKKQNGSAGKKNDFQNFGPNFNFF